jgi:hypothetical protein
MTNQTKPLTLADLPVGTKVKAPELFGDPMGPCCYVVAHDHARVGLSAVEGSDQGMFFSPADLELYEPVPDAITPSHYNAASITTFDVVQAWELDFFLGNVVKYVQRHKHKGKPLEDLKKAARYLQEAIAQLEPTKD